MSIPQKRPHLEGKTQLTLPFMKMNKNGSTYPITTQSTFITEFQVLEIVTNPLNLRIRKIKIQFSIPG